MTGYTAPSGCILLMCGLPASGKTTLVSLFHTTMKSQLRCHVVCYDKLIPSELDADMSAEGQPVICKEHGGVSPWKKCRDDILLCVDHLIDILISGGKQGKEIRSDHLKKEVWTYFIDCLIVEVSSSNDFVIIIDDNMYYRSMRYQFYQVARKHRIGFCEAYMECPVQNAIERNCLRSSGKVDEDVITRMCNKMEVPSTVNHWEKYSLTLLPEDKENCNKTYGLIVTAMADPVVMMVEEDEAVRVESREICSSNVVHQVDQIVRKFTAEMMKQAHAHGSNKENLKHMSTKMVNVKMLILNDVKSGVLSPPTSVNKDKDSEFYKFVQAVFETRTEALN